MQEADTIKSIYNPIWKGHKSNHSETEKLATSEHRLSTDWPAIRRSPRHPAKAKGGSSEASSVSAGGWPRTRPTRTPEWLRQSGGDSDSARRSEEHTSELQSHSELVCRLLLERKQQRNVLG